MVTSRIWFTAAQKAELWERWKNGQSAAAISRALERKNKTGVERIVVLHGGIGPAPRRRALAALRFEEREEISRGIAVGRSIRQIAQGLGRAPSTVSREIRRNGGSQAYRANRADRRARERALRPKPCRLALYSALRWRVAQKLALQWSRDCQEFLCARPVSSLADEPLAEDDGELGLGLEPFARRSFPFLGRVVQDQI